MDRGWELEPQLYRSTTIIDYNHTPVLLLYYYYHSTTAVVLL